MRAVMCPVPTAHCPERQRRTRHAARDCPSIHAVSLLSGSSGFRWLPVVYCTVEERSNKRQKLHRLSPERCHSSPNAVRNTASFNSDICLESGEDAVLSPSKQYSGQTVDTAQLPGPLYADEAPNRQLSAPMAFLLPGTRVQKSHQWLPLAPLVCSPTQPFYLP